MKALIIIPSEYSGLIFTLTYMAALAFGASVLLYKAYRKKYNMGSMLLILLSCLVFFIIGDKLVTVSPDRWINLLIDGEHSIPTGKTILGGIPGLLLGVFIAVRWLNFKQPVLDKLAIAFPVAIALQKVGCLFAGCCHGLPCELPWAIQYGRNSEAFYNQLQSGMVSYDHMHTMPVHPTQLYQILACLLIAYLVFRYRNSWRSKGSLFLFTILLYGVFRFVTEFFKDPVANGIGGQVYAGMQYAQWGILIAVAIITLVIFFREKYYPQTVHTEPNSKINWRHYTLFAVIVLMLSSLWGWFEAKERVMMLSVAVPVFLFLLWRSYSYFTMPAIRWGFPFILLAGFLFMGQKVVTNDKANPPSYAEFSFGSGFGRFYNEIRVQVGSVYSHTEYYEDACGGTGSRKVYRPVYEYRDRRHTFNTFAFGAKYVFRKGEFTQLHLSASYFWGTEHETDPENSFSKYYHTRGINSMARIDWQYIGIGLGATIGELRYSKYNNGGTSMADQLIQEFNGLPTAYFRIGPYDLFFAEVNYGNAFPSSSPAPLFYGGVGTGLGRTDGTRVVVGGSELGFYVNGNAVFKEKYVVNLMYNGNFKSGIKNEQMFSIGLKYRVLFKRKNKS